MISNPQLKPYQYINELVPSMILCLNRVEQIIVNNSHINSSLDRYESLVSSWHLVRSNFNELEQDLQLFCDIEWKWLEQVDEGLVCCHTLAAMSTIYSMIPFKELSVHDQNIILYGLLFHDIAKRGPPEIETKDPLHPFTSAAKALGVFARLGWIQNSDLLEETQEFIKNAFFYHKWANFMDNRKLPRIYGLLLYATGLIASPDTKYGTYFELTQNMNVGQLFVFEILAIILFHQSIDLDPKYPNFTPLSFPEQIKYLSPRLLHLITILHLGDNGSYNLPLLRSTWSFDKRILKTSKNLSRSLSSHLGKSK